ncbi:MAG: hypothetical protein HOJ21_13900, partial [Alphaproteobacteria bacterium]|nr:hypothetical protein [Alphaproteobacteria bacterium]
AVAKVAMAARARVGTSAPGVNHSPGAGQVSCAKAGAASVNAKHAADILKTCFML